MISTANCSKGGIFLTSGYPLKNVIREGERYRTAHQSNEQIKGKSRGIIPNFDNLNGIGCGLHHHMIVNIVNQRLFQPLGLKVIYGHDCHMGLRLSYILLIFTQNQILATKK